MKKLSIQFNWAIRLYQTHRKATRHISVAYIMVLGDGPDVMWILKMLVEVVNPHCSCPSSFAASSFAANGSGEVISPFASTGSDLVTSFPS